MVWSEADSYIQFTSLSIIVSQLVDPNLVFNHNSGYLFQLQLCCRGYIPKMGYLLSLVGVVGKPMVYNASVCLFLLNFTYFLLSFFFPMPDS